VIFLCKSLFFPTFLLLHFLLKLFGVIFDRRRLYLFLAKFCCMEWLKSGELELNFTGRGPRAFIKRPIVVKMFKFSLSVITNLSEPPQQHWQ